MQSQRSRCDEVEIHYTGLPDEKRDAYWESMKFITELLMQILKEEELLQVNNGTEAEEPILSVHAELQATLHSF